VIYEVYNEGISRLGIHNAKGRMEFFAPGEKRGIDLNEEKARIMVRRAGSLRIKLTEEQAEKFNNPVPDVPDNWRSLPWKERRALAASLTVEKVTSKADVERVIEHVLHGTNG